MGRLPKKITTELSAKVSFKTLVLIGLCALGLGLYIYYNLSQFPFNAISFTSQKKDLVSSESTVLPEMEAPTPQDLQALPIAQESAEEVIAIADVKDDELIQVFQKQEQSAAKTMVKAKAPQVVKRSLGLV